MGKLNKQPTVSNPLEHVVSEQVRIEYLESLLSNLKAQVQGVRNTKNELDHDDGINELFNIIDIAR